MAAKNGRATRRQLWLAAGIALAAALNDPAAVATGSPLRVLSGVDGQQQQQREVQQQVACLYNESFHEGTHKHNSTLDVNWAREQCCESARRAWGFVTGGVWDESRHNQYRCLQTAPSGSDSEGEFAAFSKCSSGCPGDDMSYDSDKWGNCGGGCKDCPGGDQHSTCHGDATIRCGEFWSVYACDADTLPFYAGDKELGSSTAEATHGTDDAASSAGKCFYNKNAKWKTNSCDDVDLCADGKYTTPMSCAASGLVRRMWIGSESECRKKLFEDGHCNVAPSDDTTRPEDGNNGDDNADGSGGNGGPDPQAENCWCATSYYTADCKSEELCLWKSEHTTKASCSSSGAAAGCLWGTEQYCHQTVFAMGMCSQP